ncbi:TetR/AcrR family transcriptional regulator [Paenibacillus sp. HN-1]|uniref:TetR/AcrR family transcriptional regulator n=1 Tax=Paenibacillus TaxID=44249 RepID=UPI001CA95172|nr:MULTISPECIES: TetR/AcrR family transcriptional regulator [Paenibacillus]MBY9078580.1 TetR/AcrR family transcriptional regulator [Paenibacillus sp. CGMCC 1.18879]MBY9083206.1 TetR/AcrR family transcriptional regulator [Paenibacillus sinensis]
MANKVMNMRMTQTKQALINSFFQFVSIKDFEKITIADIAKGAQVNRATFYAHFNDKYELLDYIVGDSASTAILNRTKGEVKFDQENIAQLVLALCDFYQQPNIQCRSSYVALVVPQLKDKAVTELRAYLLKGLAPFCSEDEKTFYSSIFAQMIHEGALQWATGNIALDKEEVAEKVAVLIVGGFNQN